MSRSVYHCGIEIGRKRVANVDDRIRLSVVEDVLGVVRGSRIQVVDAPARQRYDFETNVLPESQVLQITLKSLGVENAGLIANIDSGDMTLPKRPKNREWKRRYHQRT